MVEAIFDFKDINRRMNRKPALVYDYMTDEMVTPNELANRQADRMVGFDPAKKDSDQTIACKPRIGSMLKIRLPKDFLVSGKTW